MGFYSFLILAVA